MTNSPFIPLFSGGSGRSGTTAVVNLLHRHPEVHTSMPREIRYLTDAFGLLELNYNSSPLAHGGRIALRNTLIMKFSRCLGNKDLDRFIGRLNDKWWHRTGKTGLSKGLIQGIPKAVLDEIIQQFRFNLEKDRYLASRELFFSLSGSQIHKPGVTYFADSTPPNAVNADRIFQLLPESLFINMIRDGRDTAYSVSKEKWGPNDPRSGLEWWKSRVLRAHLALSRLPHKNVLHIRLEDLVQRDRVGSYAQILNFLNLVPAEKMDTYFNEVLTDQKMSQGVWKSKVSYPKDFDNRYQEILEELAEQGLIIAKYY